MHSLDNHTGEVATMPEETRQKIQDYLMANASDGPTPSAGKDVDTSPASAGQPTLARFVTTAAASARRPTMA